MDNVTLGGFEAILDVFNTDKEDKEKDTFIEDGAGEQLTDEELEAIRKSGKKPQEEEEKETEEDDDPIEEEEEDIEPVTKTKPQKKEKPVEKQVEEDPIEEDNDDTITNFFDALSEKLGWEDIEDDEKPRTAEELIEYFGNVITENSKPEYASEEVEALDEFVKQGGNIRDYFKIDKEVDLDELDMEDERSQKYVVKELLKEKGFNEKQIEKKLSKYEDAGILEDEATDALEDLKEIREEKKQQLLADQKKQFEAEQARQRELYNSVVTNIKGLETIRGIKVPEKDKRALIDYILKPDTDGQTRYYKDYVKGGVKSLIESAYFTMNADKLISAAESKGRTKAVDKFRNSLKSPSVSGKTQKQEFDDGTDSIWSSVTRRLRMS